MPPSLSKCQKVGVALAALSAVSMKKRKRRKKRTVWEKELYLQRAKCSHSNLIDVLDGDDIKNYLRMSEEVFEELLRMVSPIIEKQDTMMREAISPRERLMATLRYLATGRKLSDMKFSTSISPQSLSAIIPVTCEAIYQCLKHLIKVPNNEEEWKKVATEFERKWNFSNCIGCIDGRHVPIRKPTDSGSMYYNYKKFFSVVQFACVDANYQFLYVHTGTNGSAGDSTIFQNTSLYNSLINGTLKLPPDSGLPGTNVTVPYVLLGDSAFTLNKHLMKPFPMKDISREKRVFNYRLSRARRVVENAFGILASRFQVLQTTISLNLSSVDKIILACCALHNFLSSKTASYLNDGSSLDYEDIENSSFRGGSWRQNPTVPLMQQTVHHRSQEGNVVRNKFMHYFNNEGRVSFQDRMLDVVSV